MRLLAPDDTLDEISATDATSFWRSDRHHSLECLTATFRTHVFPPHTHESYVIGTVVGGQNVYRISGTLVRAGAGDLCFVNSGEVHDAIPEDNGYSYRMIYPKPSLLQSIVEGQTGRRASAPFFRTPVMPDPELAQRYMRAHEGLERGAEALGVDEALTSVLLNMIDRHAGGLGSVTVAGHEPAAVRRAKAFLVAHMEGQVDLETLARASGLSPFHLIRVFRRATGLTPHNWLIDRRVHRACDLLRGGRSATEVAAACGFSDQSHLTRVFKQRLGVTPGRFRMAAS
jgi:AraC-like DNA-binding protein